MGAAASVFSSPCVTQDCQTFIRIFLGLCPQTPTAKSLRVAQWKSCDNSGNGHVSLAEFGKWIQTQLLLSLVDEVVPDAKPKKKKKNKKNKKKLKKALQDAKDQAGRLYKLFYPCYIRAFLDAADIGKNKKINGAKTATTDDWLQKGEFRFAVSYLCIYALMFDAFAMVDGGSDGTTKDDDRRISLKELSAASTKFEGHPLAGLKRLSGCQKETEMYFKEMDADGKGMVLLKEWCQWLEKQEVSFNTKFGKLLAFAEDDL